MSDPRRSFVVNTVAGALAPPDQKETYVQWLSRDEGGAINSFLEDADVIVLQASVVSSGGGKPRLQLSTKPEFAAGCQRQVLLAKLRPGPVAVADVPQNVAVSTLAHSAVSSLYHQLRDVYGPMLTTGSNALGTDGRLAELLQQVQAGLGAAARKAGDTQATKAAEANGAAADPNTSPLHAILTPLDELDFWAELATGHGPAARAAQQVTIALEPLRPLLEQLAAIGHDTAANGTHAVANGRANGVDSNGDANGAAGGQSWEFAKEVVDVACQALRGAWPVKLPMGGWAIGQPRMEHFLRTLGAALAGHVQGAMRGVDLFATAFSDVRVALGGAGQLMSRWLAESRALSQDWAMGLDGGGHLWAGPLYTDALGTELMERLEEIHHMREAQEELGRLLGSDESRALGVDGVFAAFASLAPLQVSEFSRAAWRAAKEDYERRMAPVEQRVSTKLKELFGG